MKEFKKVLVRWVDSARNMDWGLYEDVNETPVECESVGYLIKEKLDYIVLALSVVYKPLQVCQTMTIPKCSISLIQELEISDTIMENC